MPHHRPSSSLRPLAAIAVALSLAVPGAASAGHEDLESRIEHFVLPNGMTWLVVPSGTKGEVTVLFYVASGIARENEARSGVAALVPFLWRTEEADWKRRGATNPWSLSNHDFTAVRLTWPAARLAEAIEYASRLARPNLAAFAAARQAAIAERDHTGPRWRWMIDSLHESAFVTCPYRRPVFGQAGDLEKLTADDVAEHLKAEFVPSSMIAVVAGELAPSRVRALAGEHFGALPRRVVPPRHAPREPAQRGEKRVLTRGTGSPAFVLGYHKGPGAADDITAWDALSCVLRSRLEPRWGAAIAAMRHFELAQGPAMRDDNLYMVVCFAAAGTELSQLRADVLAELVRLAREPITPEELRAAQQRLTPANGAWRSDTRTVVDLADWQSMRGDWRLLFRTPDRLKAITAEHIQSLAAATFRPENLTMAIRE